MFEPGDDQGQPGVKSIFRSTARLRWSVYIFTTVVVVAATSRFGHLLWNLFSDGQPLPAVASVAVGIVALAVAALLGRWLAGKLDNPRPLLTLSPDGVIFESANARVVIEWNVLKSVSLHHGRYSKTLFFVVHERMNGPQVERLRHAGVYDAREDGFSLPILILRDMSAEDLIKTIRRYHVEFRAARPAGDRSEHIDGHDSTHWTGLDPDTY